MSDKKINMERFVQLLEMASHEGTPPHEAHGAANKARTMLEEAGLSFKQIRFRRDLSVLMNLPSMVPSTDLLRRNAVLEESDKENKRNLEALRREVERLRKEIERHSERYRPREDGTFPWATFARFAANRLHREHGWRRVFADQFGVPELKLANWQKADRVPADAFDFAKKQLKPEGKSAGDRQTWMFHEDDMVDALVQQGKSSEEISQILTERLRRKSFSLGSVKKARQRNESRAFILAQWDAGERDLDKIYGELRATFANAKGHGGGTRYFIERVLAEMRDLPEELLSPAGLARRRKRNIALSDVA